MSPRSIYFILDLKTVTSKHDIDNNMYYTKLSSNITPSPDRETSTHTHAHIHIHTHYWYTVIVIPSHCDTGTSDSVYEIFWEKICNSNILISLFTSFHFQVMKNDIFYFKQWGTKPKVNSELQLFKFSRGLMMMIFLFQLPQNFER